MARERTTPADRAARDAEIARLVNVARVSTRDVGERFGLSAMSVSRIARAALAAAPAPEPAHAVAPVVPPPSPDPEPPAALLEQPDAPVPEGHAALVARLRAAQHGKDPVPPLAEPPLPDDAPLHEVTRRMVRQLQRDAAAAAAEGNPRLAAQLSKSAASLMPALAKAEAAAKSDDEIRFTAEEWRAAEESLRTRVAAHLQRPLLCAACNRRLSIEFGHCADKIAELDAADAKDGR